MALTDTDPANQSPGALGIGTLREGHPDETL
jgi:hypothetical protein